MTSHFRKKSRAVAALAPAQRRGAPLLAPRTVQRSRRHKSRSGGSFPFHGRGRVLHRLHELRSIYDRGIGCVFILNLANVGSGKWRRGKTPSARKTRRGARLHDRLRTRERVCNFHDLVILQSSKSHLSFSQKKRWRCTRDNRLFRRALPLLSIWRRKLSLIHRRGVRAECTRRMCCLLRCCSLSRKI